MYVRLPPFLEAGNMCICICMHVEYIFKRSKAYEIKRSDVRELYFARSEGQGHLTCTFEDLRSIASETHDIAQRISLPCFVYKSIIVKNKKQIQDFCSSTELAATFDDSCGVSPPTGAALRSMRSSFTSLRTSAMRTGLERNMSMPLA